MPHARIPCSDDPPRRSTPLSHKWSRPIVALALLAAACEQEKAPAPSQPSATAAAASTPAPAPTPPAATATQSAAPPDKPKRKKEDCPKGPNVDVGNPALEAQLRLKLQKPSGNITTGDLHKLKSLNLASVQLSELDVCVFSELTGLKELFLGPGDYDDLSPIADAKNLETLRAALSKVHDLTPLSKMTKLDRLDLGHTQVSDLKPIAGATALTELVIDDSPVADLSPLAKFTQLETLSIKNTHVKDVSVLKGMKKLKSLYVVGAPVEEDPGSFAPLRAQGTHVVTQ